MRNHKQSLTQLSKSTLFHGFTLIELMIVIAIIAIILTLALPVYSNYTIRAKVGEVFSVANAAKTAVTSACIENHTIPALTKAIAGYDFIAGTDGEDYVANVQASGPCMAPIITITTKNTGHSPDPILILTGGLTDNSGQVSWNCTSNNTPDWVLPNSCRS
jgi:type IV pilus assembly protein PilA